jgi:hypothetical protein
VEVAVDAVLVDPVPLDFRGVGIDRRVVIVAVVPAAARGGESVRIAVLTVDPIAVLVDGVADEIGLVGADVGVLVVAIPLVGRVAVVVEIVVGPFPVSSPVPFPPPESSSSGT